jgi:hypothetical protein
MVIIIAAGDTGKGRSRKENSQAQLTAQPMNEIA